MNLTTFVDIDTGWRIKLLLTLYIGAIQRVLPYSQN